MQKSLWENDKTFKIHRGQNLQNYTKTLEEYTLREYYLFNIFWKEV